MHGLAAFVILLSTLSIVNGSGNHDYHDALSKAITFFQGQRSGKLPPNQIINWRSDSALSDGSSEKVTT